MVTVGIIGGGNMGEAIISGATKNFTVKVSEKERKRQRYLQRIYGVAVESIENVVETCDVIILAIKPQDMEKVLKQVRTAVDERKIIVSIAAGITTKYIEKCLGPGARVVRSMPNMPAMIGQGVSALCKGKYAKNKDVELTSTILKGLGDTIVVPETLIDSITAVSGSGPAYVFLFIEQMTKSAISLGLKPKMAKQLVLSTFGGSIDLLRKRNADPATLRAKVTSKGGTTQAALDVFKKKGFDRIFSEAMKAAKNRAKALAK